MSGATIGSIAGGVIGAFFGPIGFQIGATVGGLIGGYIDPEVIKGPTLGDIPVQTSQEGVPRPIIFGSPQPFSGNIIQIIPKVFSTKRERVGKGGPVQESEQVHQSYAIRICRGVATVIQVWRDGKIVFDRTGEFQIDADGQAFASRTRFYTGSEDQMPDATMEAHFGVGNQPAYRGTAYMVVTMDDLTPTGGRIPNYEFRMASDATVEQINCEEEGLVFWYPLDDCVPEGSAREVIAGKNGVYSSQSVGGGPALSLDGLGSMHISDFAGGMLVDQGVFPNLWNIARSWTMTFWFQASTGPMGGNEGGSGRKQIVSWDNGTFTGGESGMSFQLQNPTTPPADKHLLPRAQYTYADGSTSSVIQETGDPVEFFRTHFVTITYEETNPALNTGTFSLYLDTGLVGQNLDKPRGSSSLSAYYLAVGGGFDGFSFPNLNQFYGYISDVKGYNYAFNYDDVLNHFLSLQGDYWVNPDAPGTYIDADGEVITFCDDRATLGEVTLASIELELARMAGVTPAQFDVSADTGVIVPGLLIGKLMAAADALRMLGGVYFRDYPEYDLQIVSTPRAGDSVVDLTDDNCIDVDTGDDQARMQPTELPRKVVMYFSDPTSAYAVVPVSATRMSINVPSEGIQTLQVPMVLERDFAKQTVEMTMKVLWEEQTGRNLIREIPVYQFAYLTPADPITYNGQRWRIIRQVLNEGTMQIECVRDRKSNYSSTAVANIVEPPTLPPRNLKGPSVLEVMNLPALRPVDSSPGVYAAVTGLTSGWPGCDLYMSPDGGVNWIRMVRMLAATTMGRLDADSSDAVDSNGYLIDGIRLKIYNQDSLDSADAAQLAAGANAFAITSPNSSISDIGQFGVAYDDSAGYWTIDEVRLGQLLTTAADHERDDSFVILDTNLYFVSLPMDYAGMDLQWKAVTIGTPLENNETITRTFLPAVQVIDGGEVT